MDKEAIFETLQRSSFLSLKAILRLCAKKICYVGNQKNTARCSIIILKIPKRFYAIR
ncbi:MAG: hypothetical protein LBU73_09340 [Helicobacteraceae bacterium]|jgi:hypothetical protein|nr:hypothetical protein [Helicobacteraceae bacterium]